MIRQFLTIEQAKTFANPAYTLVAIREAGVTVGFYAVPILVKRVFGGLVANNGGN